MHASGFEVTVFTRSKAGLIGVPEGVRVAEVKYDSVEDLQKSLKGQDAVVSMVAMSAIPNQTILIDAAILAGVKHFIPAECTVESRHPDARGLPMLATVTQIQNYLAAREDRINWNVVSGAVIEFILDAPFIIDFDKRSATLWDGGNGKLSIANFSIVASAIVGALKNPAKIQDHCTRVQGAVISQNQILHLAEKYTSEKWTIEQKDAQASVKESMDLLSNGQVPPDQLMQTLIDIYAAMAFGNGFFDAAYPNPDNEWLGIKQAIDEKTIEDAVRYRVQTGLVGNAGGEVIDDVIGGLADAHLKR